MLRGGEGGEERGRKREGEERGRKRQGEERGRKRERDGEGERDRTEYNHEMFYSKGTPF